MENQPFQSIASDIRQIDDDKRYWFIRTYGGEAFPEYMEGNYVGLGLNKVPYQYIKEADEVNSTAFIRLHASLVKTYDLKVAQATYWAKQLIAFEHEMRIGDTVLIPSINSDEIAIGTITGNTKLVEKPGYFSFRGKEEPLPEKRRSVEWIKVFNRSAFQGDIKNLISSHQGITNADDFYEAIEGMLSSLFIKDNQIHLVVQIQRNTEINAFDLSHFLNGITYFYKEFCEEFSEQSNEDLTIKIKVQSKGKTVLKAFGIMAGAGLAGLITLSNNPQFTLELGEGATKVKVEGKSEGLLQSFSEFLDRKEERREEFIRFQDSIHRLDAERKDSLNNQGTNYVKKVRKKKK